MLIKGTRGFSLDKVCSPTDKEGLSLKRLININKLMPMKLSWNIMNMAESWAKFLVANTQIGTTSG